MCASGGCPAVPTLCARAVLTVHTSIFICPGDCVCRSVCTNGLCAWEGTPRGARRQRLFAFVHVVASDVAQDEDDPEEDHPSQHLHGDAQLARAQLLGDPRMRITSEPRPGLQGGS